MSDEPNRLGESHWDTERTTEPASGLVMLALSTFRRSSKAVELALQRAEQTRRLAIVCVADVSLARYYIGTDIGLFPELRDRRERQVLEDHEQKCRQLAQTITERAVERGIEVSTHVQIGRFGLIAVEIMNRETPTVIITTRSRRPSWVKRFFGSPVDHLISHASCPVIEA